MVNLLKIRFDESLDWEAKDCDPNQMKVVPVSFLQEHKQILAHLNLMVTKQYLAVPHEHEKLIISLKTTYVKELSLDKEQASYDDSFDALRLALKAYEIT